VGCLLSPGLFPSLAKGKGNILDLIFLFLDSSHSLNIYQIFYWSPADAKISKM
jgi:hypothetical protein